MYINGTVSLLHKGFIEVFKASWKALDKKTPARTRKNCAFCTFFLEINKWNFVHVDKAHSFSLSGVSVLANTPGGKEEGKCFLFYLLLPHPISPTFLSPTLLCVQYTEQQRRENLVLSTPSSLFPPLHLPDFGPCHTHRFPFVFI